MELPAVEKSRDRRPQSLPHRAGRTKEAMGIPGSSEVWRTPIPHFPLACPLTTSAKRSRGAGLG